MKTLPLKTYDGTSDAGLIAGVMRAPSDPERGMGLEEMRRAMRILDAIEALPEGADSLALEDADAAALAAKFRAARFVQARREIVDLMDRIDAALGA